MSAVGPRLEASVAQAPLAFEPNAGRTDRSADFIAHSVAGGSLYLSAREAVLSLPQGKHSSRALRLGFPGANPAADVAGLEPLPGRANSFIGDDPSEWRSGIATYGRVRYAGIYPGIDLDFHGDQRDLEYDFRLAAGADPSQIAVEFDGADSLRVTRRGDLAIGVGKTTIRHRAPVAYQTIEGERRPVPAAFSLHGTRLGFDLGHYDRSRPLVIDPLVLGYSTYLGANGFEGGSAIAVDASGAAYVAGTTFSTTFPTQDPYQPNQASAVDAFVTKLDPDAGGAVTLAYSSYLGGGDSDTASAIAVDPTGAAYVTGETGSTNFPTQLAFQADQALTDAFVTKLNPDSGGIVTLSYSTYLGGNSGDSGSGIAADASGAAYVSGQTGSTNFPTQDQFQPDQPQTDAFAAKLILPFIGNVTPAYSTYLGGSAVDMARWIAIDGSGAAYVTGQTASTNYPTQDPLQTDQGAADAFVTKLDPDSGAAVTLAYSTYLGGAGNDDGRVIAVDGGGAAYSAGETSSTDFPTQDAFALDQGGQDAYAVKLDPESGGVPALAYSTYLGGADLEFAGGIAVDGTGAAYLTGSTRSPDFPRNDALDETLDGIEDAFVTRLAPDAGGPVTLDYSTYLGGSAGDQGADIAVDAPGVAYVTGSTASTDFPTQDPFQSNQPDADAFVTRLEFTPPEAGAAADTDPPETTITKGPKKKTKKRKAKFEFAADEPGSTFQCKLDKGDFEPCDPAEKFKVKRKKHTLEVRAVDAAGNVDPTPAQSKWKVKKKH